MINMRDLVFTTLLNRRRFNDPKGVSTYEYLDTATTQICEDIFASLCWVAEQSTCKEIMIYLLEKHIRAWEDSNG